MGRGVGRPKGAVDLAPYIRGAAMRAIKINENKRGKGLSEILAECFIKQPLATLTALAKFNPAQVNMDITHKVEVSEIIALAHQRQERMKDITPSVPVLQANNSGVLISETGHSIIEGQQPLTPIITVQKVPETG